MATTLTMTKSKQHLAKEWSGEKNKTKDKTCQKRVRAKTKDKQTNILT